MLDRDAVLSEIDERGFCLLPSVLDADRIDRLREILDQIRELEINEKVREAKHQRVLHIGPKHPLFLEPLLHDFVLEVWRRLLGEDMVCSTWSSNTLFPDFDEVYWHVDHPYWTIAPPYPIEIALTGQTIWFLDDFTEENGATAFLPGSHRISHVPTLGSAWPSEAVVAAGPRGSLLLAHGACWHSPTPNRTDRPRSALLARYARSFCVTQEDMRFQLELMEEEPAPEVRSLFCGNQYIPQRGFPY